MPENRTFSSMPRDPRGGLSRTTYNIAQADPFGEEPFVEQMEEFSNRRWRDGKKRRPKPQISSRVNWRVSPKWNFELDSSGCPHFQFPHFPFPRDFHHH
ncbi:MAG TPA: hypothetical protein VK419_06220, partial [Bryobacteraceae bacterium]|nr:hypothetical protein [Bryobacteraceae bacterium]